MQVLLAALLLAAAAVIVAQEDPKPAVAKGAAVGGATKAADKPSAGGTVAAGKQLETKAITKQEGVTPPDEDHPETSATGGQNKAEPAAGQLKTPAADAAGSNGGGGGAAGKGSVVATPEQLEQAVQEAAALQLLGKRKKVVNALVKQAAPAELTGGHGDVSVTGMRQSGSAAACTPAIPVSRSAIPVPAMFVASMLALLPGGGLARGHRSRSRPRLLPPAPIPLPQEPASKRSSDSAAC